MFRAGVVAVLTSKVLWGDKGDEHGNEKGCEKGDEKGYQNEDQRETKRDTKRETKQEAKRNTNNKCIFELKVSLENMFRAGVGDWPF